MMLGLVAALGAGCKKEEAPAPPGPPVPPPPTKAEGSKPMRILSLTPNVTEILFAMGLGDKVVGRSSFCLYPPEAGKIPAVGDTLHLNLEKIIALAPTIAFVVTRRDDIPKRLQGVGIRTVAIQSDRTEQMLKAIETIGAETGRGIDAQVLADHISVGLAKVRAQVRDLPRPRVLFAFPMTVGSPQMMVAGRGTFVDDLLDVAGGENAYPKKADWPTVGPQDVIGMAPQVVIVNAAGADAAPDRLAAVRTAWTNWKSIPAVKNDRVVILTEAYLTIPGPRVAEAARLLAEAIHPELAKSHPKAPAKAAAKSPSG